jgi:hypothetical protein
MKPPIWQSSPTAHHFIILWLKYSPQHPVLEHFQSIFLIGMGGGGGIQGPLGTAATNGLLCQPWEIMMMEKLVE